MKIALRRRPGDPARRLRLPPHRRRRARRRPAARRLDLVPGQRLPDRQGVVHDQHHDAEGDRGDLERQARPALHPPRPHDLDLGRARADGVLPRDAGDRRVRRPRLPRGRHLLLGCGRRRACSSPSPRAPATSTRYSQSADLAYKRLQHTIAVPASGGELTFHVTRDTEPTWDFFFVEAHTAGQDDWTTLPDENGHTSQSTGSVCPYWLGLHPFLEHYQTETDDGGCEPSGTTGEWHAASGPSGGYEEWTIDLSAYAGKTIELALTYASDDIVAYPGVFVDDITGPARRRHDVVRGRREHARRLDHAGRARGQRAQPERLDRRHDRDRAGAARPGDRRLARAAAGGARLPRLDLRPLPVQHLRRDRRRRPDRLRARERRRGRSTRPRSSPTRSRARTWSSTSSPTSGRATT